jgi:hypothetical protein
MDNGSGSCDINAGYRLFGGFGGVMNPWVCATLIAAAGAIGGVINALLTDKELIGPKLVKGIWCPGFLSNVIIGAFSAFASWSFYGSGAAVELASTTQRSSISLTFSALAGALLVGVAGSRWLTNEVDKRLLKVGAVEAAKKSIPADEVQRIMEASPRKALEQLSAA